MYYTLWAVRWCPRVTPSPSHTTNTALSLCEKSSPLLEIIGRNVLLSKCWQIVFTFFKHQKDCMRIPFFRYCGWYCERTQMWISLQMTHKNKFASLLYNLTRNHAVQFSLRWAVFNVAYNQKRGVSSFKLSPLVWFKVSSSPGCVHNAQTAGGETGLIILENIFYNLHLPYNLKPSRVKLGVKQVWHSSVQFKMSRFQTSV